MEPWLCGTFHQQNVRFTLIVSMTPAHVSVIAIVRLAPMMFLSVEGCVTHGTKCIKYIVVTNLRPDQFAQ